MKASRKIPMQKRETRAQRAVSFSKRRYGLFNKAAELCMLSGAQIAIVVSSPCSKESIFSFGYPSVDSVFHAFLHNRVPERADKEIMKSAISLSSEIKAFVKEPENRENIDGFLKDVEDLEESIESIDELLVVQEKVEKLRNNALMRLNDLPSKVFASGFTSDSATSNFGNNHVDNIDFSNGISTALASDFSHLDQILMNGDNNSVYNPCFSKKLANNSFYNSNANVGFNNASTSNAVYPVGNPVNNDEFNNIYQEAEFGAKNKFISNPEDDFNHGVPQNSMETHVKYENKEFPLYPYADSDAVSYADCAHQNIIITNFAVKGVPLATVNQFGQLLSYDLPYFSNNR